MTGETRKYFRLPDLTHMPDVYQTIWNYVGAVSVRTKILGIVLGLVLLLGVGITIQVRQVMHSALETRLREQAVANARDLAARATDLILINDLYALHELLVETQLNNPDVQYAFIVDAEGVIIAHTFGHGFPIDLLAANQVEANVHHQIVPLDTDVGRVWDTAVPIFDGQVGTARIGMSENSINEDLSTLTQQLLLTTAAVSAVGIVAAVLLTWIVTRPILQLKEAAWAVGKGDFNQRVRPWAGDEIGELASAFNVMTDQLAQAEIERAERARLRKLLLEKVITAQEEERQRIARELHDETGSALTSLMVRLQMMNQQCPVPALKPQINELRQLVKRTLDDVHNLAVELRPSVLDDLGLEAALKRYAQDFQSHHHLDVDLVVVGLEQKRLPPPVETALYRIVQEGLTNAARHAQAKTVSVLVERRNGRVRAFIEDDGTGFDLVQAKASGRLGLYGMQERTELLGGQFVIEAEPAKGTSIFIEVPV